MSRPQVGIDRLPARRASTEPRESMNCKSCRKRKIKCNRLRPTCEACQVFACPCIYDAVPKKRGPKTEVLEALLKRVDGLEKQLQKETKEKPRSKDPEPENFNVLPAATTAPVSQKPVLSLAPNGSVPTAVISPNELRPQQPQVHLADVVLDTYFVRIHGRPYFILDELTTRQRLQHHQLPSYLAHAIYAVSSRYASHPGGFNGAVRAGEEHAAQARMELDTDDPSIEGLQTLLLLAQANYQSGRGKRAYMLLSTAISMALALELHRELPMMINVPPSEREGRRRLFWACYLMDRFAACGSKRPSLITDESVMLRLPSSASGPNSMLLEGDFFRNGSNSNLQYMAGPGKQSQSSSVMLIGIARILGITNRYLAAGGVKGDSHFPWHSLSNLSKIRHELDMWAAETQDTFSSLETLFGHSDSTMLVLSKLIYHLIHCLIYRPFLPMDLAELSVTGQHQSWQIEATNLCFLHANAIAELVEIGRASSIIDWPAFVGYCIGTAGTIHVHGAHYRGREGEVYCTSAELLTREMDQLAHLRFVWAGVQHQRDTLQWVYGCHSEMIKTMAGNAMRFSGVLEFEDFFDRYPGSAVDGAHVTFADVSIEPSLEGISLYHPHHPHQPIPFLPAHGHNHPHNPYPQTTHPHLQPPLLPSQPPVSSPSDLHPHHNHNPHRRTRKRRSTIATATPTPITLSKTSPVPSSAGPFSQTQHQNHHQRLRTLSNNPDASEVEATGMHTTTAFQQQVMTPTPFSPGFGFGDFTGTGEGAAGLVEGSPSTQLDSHRNRVNRQKRIRNGDGSNVTQHDPRSQQQQDRFDNLFDDNNNGGDQTLHTPGAASQASHSSVAGTSQSGSGSGSGSNGCNLAIVAEEDAGADGSGVEFMDGVCVRGAGGAEAGVGDHSNADRSNGRRGVGAAGGTGIVAGNGVGNGVGDGLGGGLGDGLGNELGELRGLRGLQDGITDAIADMHEDKDPFLCLLEQLAENEVSRGGPSELDFFLSGDGG